MQLPRDQLTAKVTPLGRIHNPYSGETLLAFTQHEPVATREPNNPHIIIFSYRTLTYSGRSFQTTSPNNNAKRACHW